MANEQEKTQNFEDVKGYKINFATQTLTMNYRFAEESMKYGTEEYNLLKEVKADFPNLKIVTKAGRKITTPRKTKRLTYNNMEKYIRTFENSEELLAMFNLARNRSATAKSPYKFVCDWFLMQFPNYDTFGQITEPKSKINPVPVQSIDDYKKSENQEKKVS